MGVAAGPREPGSAHLWLALARACRRPWRLVVELATRVQNDDIFTLAAALSYYFLLSLFPFVLFVLALTTLVPIHGLEAWLLENASRSLPGEAFTLFERTLRALLDRPRGGLVSVGAALALWTASSAFTALINGLNRAYRVVDPRPWWRVRLFAIALTIALSLFMILVFVLTVFGGQLVEMVARRAGPVAGGAALVVRWTITISAVLLIVAAMYYACPAIDRAWQWLRPGTALFLLGFAASSAVFSEYVGRFASYDATYGSLGAVIILLAWMYLLALFLLLGGELNALLECRIREREAAMEIRIGEADDAASAAR
jgi:membrane protein